MNIRQRLQLAVVLLLAMLTVSVAGYRLLGGPSVSFLNALYMAVITLAGVGICLLGIARGRKLQLQSAECESSSRRRRLDNSNGGNGQCQRN